MICQPNNWNIFQMLENLSTQAIYYRPGANGPTGISNTADAEAQNILGRWGQ